MKINSTLPEKQPYLQIVSNIAKPPERLYYLGELPTKRLKTVAIVGSRKPTAYGQELAYRMAYDLAKSGVVIVSGLALGLDAIAHRAAIEAGGLTIAVMAGGLDVIHPATNRQLAINILQARGALISEYPPGVGPKQYSFVARNRLVAGISDGLLVIEATAKSGTMHTANFALEQGKAVMAIPGNITSPMSEGCNNLIKSGARLVTKVDDVLDEIGLSQKDKQFKLPLAASVEEQVILKLIASGVRDGEELQAKSGLSAASFGQTLTLLEITGRIRPLGGNQWGIKS